MNELPREQIIGRPVESLPGVGSAYVNRLERVGVQTIGDLLRYFPRRYDDLRQVQDLAALLKERTLPVGENLTVRAKVRSVKLRRLRGRRSMVTAVLGSEQANLEAVWWGQPYLAETLQEGREYIFAGKLRASKKYGTTFQSPAIERRSVTGEQTHTARLVPVYPETEGLSSRWLRFVIKPLLPAADRLPETLPDAVRERAGLLPLSAAIRQIHFPADEAESRAARRRFDFEHVFYRQLITQRRRQHWREETTAPRIAANSAVTRRFLDGLPWSLTDGQRQALQEIFADLDQDRPMLRLLQGDVGSGKTAVAAAAAHQVVAAGWQAAMMVPTEVLARQHAATLDSWFSPHGITVALLVGGQSEAEKEEVRRRIAAGDVQVVVGTHALIRQDARWHRLGLAIVDEQHRFGVEQRAKLRGEQATPHLLSMTATPIPRTLALIAYGDQDLSIIPERPAGRAGVSTRVVAPAGRQAAFAAVREELAAGRQAFVLYPVIADSKAGLKAAEEEYERLATKVFEGFRTALLHGRMKTEDKVATMEAFADGATDVLVSTSVVEVGVDFPNASVMLIEEAQQFGLAQLHQLRGRIGRGGHRSYCYLLPGDNSTVENERLKALERSDSGFELAEIDLELRGPGEVVGLKQSGHELSAAGLADANLLREARDAATELLEQDPRLKSFPDLRQRVMHVASLV
ncbi:MAG: ATP-dependent DNA helicase RecG [Patescibacteria group bacterium]